MIKKVIFLLGFLCLLLPISANAQYTRVGGYAEQGGNVIVTSGVSSTTKAQKSFPLCTVTIYAQGTTTLSTIYSDSSGTAKANPFTADSTGYWFFYAAAGRYDVKFSGTGISTPFTISDYTIGAGGGGSGTPAGSSGQLQYNNSGSFGGFAGSIISGSNLNLTGITQLGTGTNSNEAGFADTGATATMLKLADSSNSSFTNSLNPSLIMQTWRSTATSGCTPNVDCPSIVANGFVYYKKAGLHDAYVVYALLKDTTDYTGFPSASYNIHAGRSYAISAGTGVPVGATINVYGHWIQGETQSTSISAVGAQIDSNNLSGADAPVSLSTKGRTVNLAFNHHSGHHNTAAIYSQATNSTAPYTGWYFDPDSVTQRILDFTSASFTLQGTWTASAATTIAGSGGHADVEVVAGDIISVNGTLVTVASAVANTITLTATFSGTPASGLTITKKVQPIWLANNAGIWSNNAAANARYNLIKLGTNDFVTIDNNGRTTTFGTDIEINYNAFLANVGTASNKVHIGTASTDAARKYVGIWFGNATTTLANYAFVYDPDLNLSSFNGGTAIDFRINNAVAWIIDASRDFLPQVDASFDLGDATHKVRNLYLSSYMFHGSVAFASLGTPANGSQIYCSDCNIANPCSSGGTGAMAKRIAGAWVCN